MLRLSGVVVQRPRLLEGPKSTQACGDDYVVDPRPSRQEALGTCSKRRRLVQIGRYRGPRQRCTSGLTLLPRVFMFHPASVCRISAYHDWSPSASVQAEQERHACAGKLVLLEGVLWGCCCNNALVSLLCRPCAHLQCPFLHAACGWWLVQGWFPSFTREQVQSQMLKVQSDVPQDGGLGWLGALRRSRRGRAASGMRLCFVCNCFSITTSDKHSILCHPCLHAVSGRKRLQEFLPKIFSSTCTQE